ncbi:MAG: hypothetical protein LLF92_08165 [Planctomycetaceae bacterium]|nr:hypothetical protein [Planctomycetaceae bacterium]
MNKQLLIPALLLMMFMSAGCTERLRNPAANAPAPMFKNGDVVICETLKNNMVGIVTQCDYKYIPDLKTYYCAVDFYPSSAMQKNFSRYNNCERRYIYEHELKKENKEMAQKIRQKQIPTRWDWMYRD